MQEILMTNKQVILLVALSFFLSIASYYYQWYDEGEFGTECEERILYDEPCLVPLLRGGFPIAYVFDAPGVSVMNSIDEPFIIDRVSIVAFLANVAVYAIFLYGLFHFARDARTIKKG
jgi:hypothetical protein